MNQAKKTFLDHFKHLDGHPTFEQVEAAAAATDIKEDRSAIKELWKGSFRRLKTWSFWRKMIIYFIVFSFVGHWMEIPYCMFNDHFFGIVDENSIVWSSPFYPFCVYGIGMVVIALLIVPYGIMLRILHKSKLATMAHFYVVSVFFSMVMELAQGFIQNMPDENGVYPLWDNSQLPGNILGQAWIVNDVLLGLVIAVCTWFLYPKVEHLMAKIPPKVQSAIAIVGLPCFIVLAITMVHIYG